MTSYHCCFRGLLLCFLCLFSCDKKILHSFQYLKLFITLAHVKVPIAFRRGFLKKTKVGYLIQVKLLSVPGSSVIHLSIRKNVVVKCFLYARILLFISTCYM